MFKVKAKFIGINSLGFINGKIYEMILISMSHIGKGMISIETENHKPKLRCEYGSWEKFILNWEILQYENMSGDHEAEVHHAKVNSGLKSSVRDNKIKKILT